MMRIGVNVDHEVAEGQRVCVVLSVDFDDLTPEMRRWVSGIITAATVPFPGVAHDSGRAEDALDPSPAPIEDGPLAVVEPPALPDSSPPAAGTARPQAARSARGTILAALGEGPVESPGAATALLIERTGLTHAKTRITTILRELEAEGRIVVTRPNARRIDRIALAADPKIATAAADGAVQPVPGAEPPLEGDVQQRREDAPDQRHPASPGPVGTEAPGMPAPLPVDPDAPYPTADRLAFNCFHGEHDLCHERRKPCSCTCHFSVNRTKKKRAA